MGAAARLSRRTPASLLDEIAEVVGDDATTALAAAFAGRQLYVPVAPGADHPIAAAIGHAAALRLAEFYHGTRLELPLVEAKRWRILALHAARRDNRAISAIVGCSDRFVRKVVAEGSDRCPNRRDDPGQGCLFD